MYINIHDALTVSPMVYLLFISIRNVIFWPILYEHSRMAFFSLASCFALRAEFSLPHYPSVKMVLRSRYVPRSESPFTPVLPPFWEAISGCQAHPYSRVHLHHVHYFTGLLAEMDLPAVVTLRPEFRPRDISVIASLPSCTFSIHHCLRTCSSRTASSRLLSILPVLQATHCPVERHSFSSPFGDSLPQRRDRHHSPGDSLSCEMISTQPPADSLLLVECWIHHELYLRDFSVPSTERRIIFLSVSSRRLSRPPFRSTAPVKVLLA